jgi:hypothetical protein
MNSPKQPDSKDLINQITMQTMLNPSLWPKIDKPKRIERQTNLPIPSRDLEYSQWIHLCKIMWDYSTSDVTGRKEDILHEADLWPEDLKQDFIRLISRYKEIESKESNVSEYTICIDTSDSIETGEQKCKKMDVKEIIMNGNLLQPSVVHIPNSRAHSSRNKMYSSDEYDDSGYGNGRRGYGGGSGYGGDDMMFDLSDSEPPELNTWEEFDFMITKDR